MLTVQHLLMQYKMLRLYSAPAEAVQRPLVKLYSALCCATSLSSRNPHLNISMPVPPMQYVRYEDILDTRASLAWLRRLVDKYHFR